MADIRKLIEELSESENEFLETQFIAPCVKGGRLKARISGLVYTLTPEPQNFEGWGIFQAVNPKTAKLLEEAILPEVGEYLRQFKSCRLRLAYKLRSKTWLAYPTNEADFKRRFGRVKPVPVHLVAEALAFEQVVTRWDGGNFWFEEPDRRDDLMLVECLQNAFKERVEPEALRLTGLTPEMATVYNLAIQQTDEFSQYYRDERRLKNALKRGGGELKNFRDRGDYWTVEWTTSDGEFHSSAISKSDLTVLGAGICLSGRDRHFDLQSLVGVAEGRNYE